MIMNTPLAAVNGLRWKTYITGAICSVPALFFWGVAVVLILPKVKSVLSASGHDASDVGWLSTNPLFLVAYGRFILIPIIMHSILWLLFLLAFFSFAFRATNLIIIMHSLVRFLVSCSR